MASLKGRWPLFAFLGWTDYFWAKANAIHFVLRMKYIISVTNISQNIAWRTQICQYSKKQNTCSIAFLSRYKTSSLNPQSKLKKKNNLVFNKNISLDSLLHSNTFAKTYRKFWILIYKLMRGNLDTKFDLNWLLRISNKILKMPRCPLKRAREAK